MALTKYTYVLVSVFAYHVVMAYTVLGCVTVSYCVLCMYVLAVCMHIYCDAINLIYIICLALQCSPPS
jgi:hypothetical protein